MLENKELTGIIENENGEFQDFCYSILPPSVSNNLIVAGD
jgi:hypothetical protein